jgi:hypothetical protein
MTNMTQSNWSNEKLRAYRRSKFNCALLSAMRTIPIDGTGGRRPGAGTIANPNYSVSLTHEEAKASRAQFDPDKGCQATLSSGYPKYVTWRD